MIKMPESTLNATTEELRISEVFPDEVDYAQSQYPWANKFVGRFPLPDFQRSLCWTETQNIAFIESIFLGYDIGSYMVNSYQMEGDGTLKKYSEVLIDGQQRITAICLYISDQLKVCGAYYSEISRRDKMRFKQTQFSRTTIDTFDADVLKDAYNRLNFTGVNHTEDQKA